MKEKEKGLSLELSLMKETGKGLSKAEQNQITYHSPGKFDARTGNLIHSTNKKKGTKYQDVFGKT